MSETEPGIAMLKRVLVIVSVLLVLLGIGLGVWLAYRPVPELIQGMVDTDEINVSTKVPSRVEKLWVDEGDHVQAGQVLVTLSSPEVAAKQQQANGALTSAQALQSRAEKGARQEDINSLKATWQSAAANAELAQKSYVRADNLYAKGVISTQRRDEALAAKQATAQMAEATHQQYLKALSGATSEEKSTADAQVQIAKAAVAEASALQEETVLSAPASGEIHKRFANVGELVPLGIPLFTLVDLDHVWVTLNVREDQFHGLKTGQVLRGDVPALDIKGAEFKVYFIAAEGDFATWRATRQSSGFDIRTFEVRAKPVKNLPGLRPGMSVLFGWPP